jgi:hypothetical protein
MSVFDPKEAEMTTETGEKARESRLRRMAARHGLAIRKSRVRDPRAVDYGTYTIIDATLNAVVSESMDLDDVERFLTEAHVGTEDTPEVEVVTMSGDDARMLTDEVKKDAAALWDKLLRLYRGGAHLALGYTSWGEYFVAELGTWFGTRFQTTGTCGFRRSFITRTNPRDESRHSPLPFWVAQRGPRTTTLSRLR